MGEVYFYHLTRSPLEAVLPMLLDRALGAGWRVAVRMQEAARVAWLDGWLWQGSEESFLPHGISGGLHDALQPVLLTTGALPVGVACLMVVDGAEVQPGECQSAARTCIVFDGNDPQALATARGQWKSLTGAGLAAQYWSEDGGRWQKKAEAGGG